MADSKNYVFQNHCVDDYSGFQPMRSWANTYVHAYDAVPSLKIANNLLN